MVKSGAQGAASWIFDWGFLPGGRKCYKNVCPPRQLAELSSPIFTFGLGVPLAAALCAASQASTLGTINRIFDCGWAKNTPHGPRHALLVPWGAPLSGCMFGLAVFGGLKMGCLWPLAQKWWKVVKKSDILMIWAHVLMGKLNFELGN